jgi:hypothetical protein
VEKSLSCFALSHQTIDDDKALMRARYTSHVNKRLAVRRKSTAATTAVTNRCICFRLGRRNSELLVDKWISAVIVDNAFFIGIAMIFQ